MKKGKCRAQDFTEADLPNTRKDVFFDCYREHFGLVFRLGLLCLLFLVPTLVVLYFKDLYIVNGLAALQGAEKEEISAMYYAADMIFGLIQILPTALFFLLFSGVVQILRQLTWNEPIFLGDDFKDGVKGNGLRFTLTALLLSLIAYLLSLLQDSMASYVLYGIFMAVVAPIAIWYLLQTLYYRLEVGQGIRNGALFYVKTFPVTALLLICTVVPIRAVLDLIPILSVKYIVTVVLAVFGTIPLSMAWILYACHIFDRYINREKYPSVYRKGMRPEGGEESGKKEEN